MEGISLLEILIWIKECGLKIYSICPIRIEIIYGRGKFVGDLVTLSAQKFYPYWYHYLRKIYADKLSLGVKKIRR